MAESTSHACAGHPVSRQDVVRVHSYDDLGDVERTHLRHPVSAAVPVVDRSFRGRPTRHKVQPPHETSG